MEQIIVETLHFKIKKQNSKTYYTTFTEPYNYLTKGFNKVFFIIFWFKEKNNLEVLTVCATC